MRWAQLLWLLQVTALREFPGCSTGRKKPRTARTLSDLTRWSWDFGENRRQNVTELGPKRRVLHRENSGDLQISALTKSTEYWSTHVCGKTTQGQRKDHIIKSKCNSDWYSHRAKTITCSYQPYWITSRLMGQGVTQAEESCLSSEK